MTGTPDPHAVFASLGAQYGQLGLVVDDLERSLSAHAPLGPWAVYTYDPTTVRKLHVGGEPAEFAIRIAINRQTPQLELIEPLGGDNPYTRWLGEHGPGLHHVGFYVDDAQAATAAMRRGGFAPLMGGVGFGADGTGEWCYYDTAAALGYVAEAIQVPVQRRPPEAVVEPPEA